MKKVFITSIALLLSLAASAAVQIDGLWYNLNSNNNTAEVVASQGTKYSGDISIPNWIYYQNTSYNVTSIGNNAFKKCTSLMSVTIPSSMVTIGVSAFEDCSGLTSITIPSSVKTLEQGAFYGCSSLTCVKIPEGVTKIGLGAFSKCSKLTSVIIPSTVTQIDEYAFDYCTSLSHIVSEIQQPNTIKSNVFDTHSSSYSVYSQATLVVADGSKSAYKSKAAWSTFTNIKEASEQTARTIRVAKAGTLPDLISDLEKYKIEELTLTGELNGTDIRLIRDMAGTSSYGRSHGSFAYYVSTDGKLKTLNIFGANIVKGGDGYVTVPWELEVGTCSEDCYEDLYTSDNTISHLFFYLTKLESIVIPKSVTSIAPDAFKNCPSLNSLKVGSGNPYYDSRDNCNAIIEKSSNTLIAGCKNSIVPNGVTGIGANVFDGCSGLTSITIPNSVTSIGSNAFNGTGWYNNQPDGLVYAGNVAYKYKGTMPNNTSIIIKDGTLGIAGSAFQNCSDLTSITIPNSVTSIGSEAFSGCSGLTSITIPNSVTSIGESAFSYCSGLTTIVSEIENPYAIGDYVFYYYSKDLYATATLIVPSGKKSAYRNTSGWKKFQNIVEVGGVGYEFEFDGIRYKVGENNTVAVIKRNPKYSGDVVIPSQVSYNGVNYIVTTIGSMAFGNYCTELTSVTIPPTVTCIEEDAFCDYLFDLNAIYITDLNAWCGISINGAYSDTCPFNWAKHLYLNGKEIKDLVIPSGVTSINNATFYGCSGLTSVTISNSVTSIGQSAFKNCNELSSLLIPNSVTSIGSSAFNGCEDLVRIVSRSKIPPTCESSAFSSKAYCTVWVPRGCREAYLKANEWKDFKEIKEIDGDINLDNKVSKADIDALVTYIMYGTPAIYGTIADLNNDENVNAADVVTLVNLLNNGGLSTEFQPYFGNNNGNLVVTSITCTLNNDRNEAIQLMKCELYCNNSLVSYKSKSGGVTVAAGGSKDYSFTGLSMPANGSNFTVVWHYTYNGENFAYRCDLTE